MKVPTHYMRQPDPMRFTPLVPEEPLNVKLTNSKVAVDQDYYWIAIDDPVNPCPHGVKVQLWSRAGGVAHYGTYHGPKDKFYTDWAPLPKKRPNQ